MPQGLQVWDAAGEIVIDIGSRPIRLVTVATLTEGVGATVSTPVSAGATVVAISTAPPNADAPMPRVTGVSGSNVTIGWGGPDRSSSVLVMIAEY